MVAKIDWDKRQIIGKSGTIYKISPETLSSGRAPEFEIRSILLAYRTDFETLLTMINKATKLMDSATAFGPMYEASAMLKDFQKGLINYQLNKRPAVIEFASLFCIKEGEDVGNHSEDIVREKYEDWRDIPEADFFLLCANVIPSFKENYLNIIMESNPKRSQ